MPFARRVPVLLALLALLAPALAPPAWAHAGDEHEGEGEEPGHEDEHEDDDHEPGGPVVVDPNLQGTRHGTRAPPPYWKYYGNAWIYGSYVAKPFEGQLITMLAGDEEWLTWIDSFSGDVYAYNLAAGDGFFVTTDEQVRQRRPDISDGVIVFEDDRSGGVDIVAYFLETGETRRLSRNGAWNTNAQNPSIDGTWVAWEDDRDDEFAVYAYDLQTDQEVKVSGDVRSRNTDPVVLGDYVLWRTYRFNVWDVMWFNLRTGETGSATADRAMEMGPVRAGGEALFLKETDKGWLLHRWDPVLRLTRATDIYFSSPMDPVGDGDRVLQVSFDQLGASFIAHNLTNGYSNRVTGFLPIIDTPVFTGRTLHAAVLEGETSTLLTIDLNPFATMRPPRLVIETPGADHVVRGGEVIVRGRLGYEESWGEPDFFVYGINGRNFTRIAAGPQWAFSLDLRKHDPGVYVVNVEAHYKDGPPQAATVSVVLPGVFDGLDVEEAGYAFHAARVYGMYYRYVGSNPVVLALFALSALAVALWVVRYRMTVTPRKRGVIELVRPDE